MGKKGKQKRVIYSTNPDYTGPDETNAEEGISIDPASQRLRLYLDRKNRGGKTVTIVAGFEGSEQDLRDLAKTLKSKCGVGGAVKEGEILVQGNFRDKVLTLLTDMGYTNCKKVGG